MIKVPSKVRCVSFDIFDTLLIRKYVQPIDLFNDLGNRFENEIRFIEPFAETRVKAEFELRKKTNFNKEVTIDEIYSVLKEDLSLDDDVAKEIQQAELELEKQTIVAIKEVVDLVHHIRGNGYDVIFTSDTYLPEAYIRELLLHHGIFIQNDFIYASSSISLMKANGGLFSYILEHKGLKPEELMHIGDNRQSDYEVPLALGIAAHHYKGSQLNRYETDSGDRLLESKIAGIARSTRLGRLYDDTHHQTIWNVTAGVSGPMVFVMVSWCIRSAINQGMKRLYFLSRDGQIMFKVAQQIVDRYYREDIELRYLYVSRQALLFPSICRLDEEALGWIMAPTSILTPRIILNRINFSPEEAVSWLIEKGFESKLDKHLDGQGRQAFRAMLVDHEEEILQKAREYRIETVEYLKQEKMLDHGLFGVVDIGWSGTLQRSISRLLELTHQYDKPIAGYYFGIKRRQLHKSSDNMYAWFSDCENPRRLDADEYIIPMTELFTAADHGGVVRYVRKDGRVTPILKSETNQTGMEWGVQTQQEGILKYAENALDLLTRDDVECMDNEVVNFLERNYRLFFTQPDRFEAETYGRYPLAEEQNEAYHMPMAQPYTIRDLLRSRFKSVLHHHNEWKPAAFKLSNKFVQTLLQ